MQRLILALVIVATMQTLRAQESIVRLGITGSAALNMHAGELTTADGLLECGTFTNATSLGWMAGNAIWVPVTNRLVLDGRIQYWKADGTFTAANDVQPNVALPDGSLVRMQSEYELQTTLDYINVDLLALWYFTPQFFAGLGPQIGFNTRASFTQSEKILEPQFLEFTQGGRERTFLASSFNQNGTQAGIRIAASALVGYDIRLTNNIYVTPELGYAYGFTNVLNTSNWKVHAARAGVTVSWAILPDAEPTMVAAPEAPVAQAEPAKPMRSMSLTVKSTMADGTTLPGADVLITELRNYDAVPILPYVFFDVNSTTIPTRYHAFTNTSFDEGTIQDSVLGVYHELLNIVGSRMRRYPDATISIGGYREPADGEVDSTVSAGRASEVRNYLVRNWGIDPQRIRTTTGVAPSILSSRGTTDGRTENRRAEITTSDQRILAPVMLSKIDRTVEPRNIAIVPQYATPEEVTRTTVTIKVAGAPVAPPLSSTSQGVTWNTDGVALAKALGKNSHATGSIEATATYTDGAESTEGSLMAVRRMVRSTRFSNEVVNDSVIERFRLIFFDFDKPTVSDFNKSMIDLVRSRIRTTSSISVTGLTDRIGSVEHNTALSQRRAETIESSIKERIVPERFTTKGAGPMLIYNNDLPEGRWYNRTVLIEVATPVEEQ